MIAALILGGVGVVFALVWGIVHHYQFFVIQGGMINSGIFGICAVSTFIGLKNVFTGGSGWWWVLVVPCLLMGAICVFNMWRYYLGSEDRELRNARIKAIKDSLPEDLRGEI